MENSSEKNLTIRNEVLDWAQNIAVILTVFVLLFTFVFKIIGVEGSSMVPTLHNNDWLIISHLKKDYKAGDIVVIRKKKFMEVPIVKRIIATGGQDNVICVWKMKKNSLKKEFEIHGHTDDVTCLVFDCHKHLYSASRDCSIKIWDLDGLY